MEEKIDCEPKAKSPEATTAKPSANSPIATTPNNSPTSGCSTASLISPTLSETDSSMGRKSRGKKRTQDGSVETAATVTPEKKNNNDTSTDKSSAEETEAKMESLVTENLKLRKKYEKMKEKVKRRDKKIDQLQSERVREGEMDHLKKRLKAVELLAKGTADLMKKGNTETAEHVPGHAVNPPVQPAVAYKSYHIGVISNGQYSTISTSSSSSSMTVNKGLPNADQGNAVTMRSSHPKDNSLTEIKHFYHETTKDKTRAVYHVCKALNLEKVLVYCNSQEKVETVAAAMVEWNESIATIPANGKPVDRQIILTDFLDGPSRMLITTDVLEKWEDFEKVRLIINLDLPMNLDIYRSRFPLPGDQKKSIITVARSVDDFRTLLDFAAELGVPIVALPNDKEEIM